MALARQVFPNDGTARSFIVPAGVNSIKVVTERNDGLRYTNFERPYDGSGELMGMGNSAGMSFLDADGMLYSWGVNGSGENGINSLTAVSSPTLVYGPNVRFQSLWSRNPSFAMGRDGVLYSWGTNNANGQGGNGTITNYTYPTPVVGPRFSKVFPTATYNGAESIGYNSGGGQITFASDEMGNLWGWGYNSGGCAGNGQAALINTSISSPIAVVGAVTQFTKVWPWGFTVFATNQANGNLYAWGVNTNGNLGVGDTNNRSTPTLIASNFTAVQMTCGTSNTFALDSLGRIWCWGANTFGVLGQNNLNASYTPVQWGAATGKTFKKISYDPYQYSFLAQATDGTVWGSGANNRGQLGVGDVVNRSSPTQIAGGTVFQNMYFSASLSSVYAYTAAGQVFSWGMNTYGQLGQNDQVARSSPTAIFGLGGITNMRVYPQGQGDLVFAFQANGTVFSWGANKTGLLGQNTAATFVSVPTLVAGTKKWLQIIPIGPDLGTDSVMGLATDGTVWAWGVNSAGSAGVNVAGGTAVPGPTQMSGMKFPSLKPYQETRILAVTPGAVLPVTFLGQVTLGTTVVGQYAQKLTVEYDQ